MPIFHHSQRRCTLFAGPGAARAICRELNWGETPIGWADAWPESLRAAVRICLESKTAMAVWAGESLTLLHNEGYGALLGSQAGWVMGKTAEALCAEPEVAFGRELRQVMNLGIPLRREGEHACFGRRRGSTYSLTPIRDESGRAVGVLEVLEELSTATRRRAERQRVEAQRVEHEVRQATLLKLSDALRPLSDPAEIKLAASAILGEHLNVAAVGYTEVEPDGELSLSQRHYGDGRVRCRGGRLRLADFGRFAEVVGQGESLFVEDTFSDPCDTTSGFDFFETAKVRSVAAIPLYKHDTLVAYLYAAHCEPRKWTAIDRELLGEVAERTWAAVERARAEEALREADRRKNHFLAVLSHELRNPLTPIKNSLYVLDRVAPGGEQAHRAKEVIERQIDQLAHLVDELLDVTRIARGKIQLQRCQLELNELVRRTIEDHRAVFERLKIDLVLKSSRDPVFIFADWNRIAQVISNLLQNAAKFTPPGGSVRVVVSSELEARRAVVRVVDTGAGLTRDMLPRIFEPFMQADETREQNKGGLGLGLALVKGLIDQHGGSIEAHSAGPSRGAEFIVRLPLDSDGVEIPASVIQRQERPSRRVLVIEDNIDAADSLREVLELDGHQVAVAYDGREGLTTARAFRPELVLCDIGLPGMDGYQVATAFRADETLRVARLIALSGYALPEDLQRAAEAGFDEHLAKPPSLEKLEKVLRGSFLPETRFSPVSVDAQ